MKTKREIIGDALYGIGLIIVLSIAVPIFLLISLIALACGNVSEVKE